MGLLLNLLNINPLDILELNASRNNSVDDVRDKITNFIQMIPFGAFKVVFLDEFEFFSTQGQAALRGVMEEYHDTARFILTASRWVTTILSRITNNAVIAATAIITFFLPLFLLSITMIIIINIYLYFHIFCIPLC